MTVPPQSPVQLVPPTGPAKPPVDPAHPPAVPPFGTVDDPVPGKGLLSSGGGKADDKPIGPTNPGVAKGEHPGPPHRGRPVEPTGGPAVASATRAYRVRAGQTLTSIASEVYGDPHLWKQIVAVNPGINPSRLKVGAKIQIPEPSAVRSQPIVVVPDTSADDSHRKVIRASDVVVGNDDGIETPTPAGTTYVVQPGDTLYKIAKRRLGSSRRADALYELNRDVIGSDAARLSRGMVLRLPTAADGMLSDASR